MATAKLSLSFRIFKNDQLVRETTLNQSVIKIGKVTSAHLHLEDELVSRMHAIIEIVNDDINVIDLGSTGGTFVNGKRINKAKLQSGDVLQVGNSRIEVSIAQPSVVVAPQVTPPPVPAKPVLTVVAPPTPVVMTATMPATPVAKPVAAPMAKPLAAPQMTMLTAAPTMMQQAFAAEADMPGARAVEVAAMLGDSVIGVKHCMDPRGGKITRGTWAFAAGGLACLLASGIAFGVSVHTATRNKDALAAHLAKGAPERAFRPEMQSPALDFVAFGGIALGLLGLTTALARARGERKSPYYRIGTAPEVEQPLEGAPSPSFPLVAPHGDDFVFNYGAGMDGELMVDGTSTSFADLAAQGRARQSQSIAGAMEMQIPNRAKIRARAGGATFLVTAVAKPRGATSVMFNLESRTLAYVGGSLAAHLALVGLLAFVPVADAGVSTDMNLNELGQLRSASITKDEVPDEVKPDPDSGNDSGKEGAGATMTLDEGAAGKPDAVRTDGHQTIKNNQVDPQLARTQAIEMARNAGVLGDMAAIKGGIAALTGTADFSSGFSDADIYGPLIGADGEGKGNFGFGRKNWGPGGGCFQEPCGLVGTGRYGTIGDGNYPGDPGYKGHGGWGPQRRHESQVPTVAFTTPNTVGNLDRAIIKRYIKRNVDKIAYCYESELLARPGIEGTVMVNFLITGTGNVQQSTGSGFDPKVSGCVAGVIKNIEFPRPTDGGNVQVNYPFTFHAAGK